MRILLITDNHTPTGGAEKYFFDLKSRLQKAAEIEVFSCGFSENENQDEHSLVLKRIKSDTGKWLGRFVINPITYFKLKNYIHRINPDVIHLHNVKQHTAAVLQAIKPYPIVQTVHDFSLICPTAENMHEGQHPCATGFRWSCFWKHRNNKYGHFKYLLLVAAHLNLKRQLKKSVKKFIAPSPFLANYLTSNEYYNVIDITPFQKSVASTQNTTIDNHHFLYAGGFESHKGIHLLLDEFAMACKKNPALKLSIAGNCNNQTEITHRLDELNIKNNVNLLGWQTDLTAYYQQCSTLIFPSIGLESFGLVITEAMSHARAVIGVNYGTSAWLIDDQKTGLHFDPNKKGDLAEKILALANQVDVARQLGKNGREKLNAMIDNEKVLEQIISVYREVIDRSNNN